MLGRLLSTAIASPAAKQAPTVHDEAEDAHTRALLYQGHNTFSTCNCFETDSKGCIRDVRVVISQDSVNGEPKLTIYDSVPIAQPHPRKADAPRNRRRSGARLSISDLQFTPNTGVEDERKVLQECMFGSSIMAYKGPSTKVHVLPSTTQAPITTSASAPNTLRRGSLKAPPIGQISTSTQDLTANSASTSTQDDIKSVLITRTFNVVLPSPSSAAPAPQHQQSQPQHHVSFKVPPKDELPVTPGSSVGSTHGFPSPNMGSKAGTPPSALKAVKPPKTINYAIGIVISIPTSSIHQQSPTMRPNKPLAEVEFADPLATIRRPNQGPTLEDPAENLVDNRMDLVTKNWDIITRTLNELQVVATQRITSALNARSVVILSPPTYGPQRKTSLDVAALMNDAVIKEEVERQRWRITTGLQIPRVITGQGRWSEWKEEAKWADGMFGGRDRNFFFLTLLTAFLGHHPDWLDVLAPPAYRRRHVQRQRTLGKEDAYLPSRTVIVCDNKFVSRRLIYLMAAFLPERSSPTTHWTGDYTSSNRSTTSDDGLVGHSPPNKGPEFKREIRRVPSKLSMVEGVDESDTSNLTSTWDVPKVSGRDAADKDKASSRIGTSLPTHLGTTQLPIPFSAPRKAPSTTTTDSIVPHPANLSSSFKRENPEPRPGSSGSSISMSLMQTLRRSGSNNTSGNTNESSGGTNASGWGSFLSSIWSNPRSRGSASVSSSLASTIADDTNAESGKMGRTGPGLSDQVYYEDNHGYPGSYDGQGEDSRPLAFSPPTHWHQDGIRTPGFEESTLRYSVDDEGIIDVDIPMGLPSVQPSFDMGGLGAIGSSPLPSSPTSTNAAESSMENSLISLSALTLLPPFPQATGESETTGNVAAELDRFHPDFILQAVKSYRDLEKDIRRGMQAEPTPAIIPSPANKNGREEQRWIDICSTLIADTNTMKIRRLTLRRKRRPVPFFSQHLTPAQLVAHSYMRDEHEEEQFIEEQVMDMEERLVSAVEKVVGVSQSPKSGGMPSRAATVKSSKPRPQNPRRRTDAPTAENKANDYDTRKAVLGSLEDVVRKVADDRNSVVENVLTEGVAKWLNELEDAGAV
ncbi:hypothetical protein TWF696_006463 [Orbilia brochopaga]|uniref:Folliculin-interacting protein N-terminal domain-containing protein n=1 Tax=Orbilia brochopaga TaxID=3140254 RepID=A0AAV9V0D7_9PEZI